MRSAGFLRHCSLPVLLFTVSLSAFAWLFLFSTQVPEGIKEEKHGNVPSSIQPAEPSSQLLESQMEYLTKLGDLFAAETLPTRSEQPMKTMRVTQQQQPEASKKPGVTRFVCLSDTHGLHSASSSMAHRLQVPEGDVLLFGGDAGISAGQHVPSFRSFLQSQPHSKKVVTFGNMDHWVESSKYSSDAFPEADAVLLGDATSAHATIRVQQAASEEGPPHTFHVTGSPYTPKFYGSFQLQDEKDAEEHWKGVLPPEVPVDILITHGPPHGTGDLTKGRNVGDKKLLEAVQKLEHPPVLWIVGHIHNGYGAYKLLHERSGQEIVVANVATNDLRSGKDTPPMIFDVEPPVRIVGLGRQPYNRQGR